VDPSNPAPPFPSENLGFTEREADSETGLVNMLGRLYDPKIGRFVSPDPLIGDPLSSQSYNRYSYVDNNPLRWTDPTGFQCFSGSWELGGFAAVPCSPPGGPSPSAPPLLTGLDSPPTAPPLLSAGISDDTGLTPPPLFHLLPDSATLTCDLCAMTLMPDVWIRGFPITPDLMGQANPPPTFYETNERNTPQLSGWKVPDALEGVPNKEVLTSSIQDPLVIAMAPQVAPLLIGIRADQALNVANSLRQQGQTGNAALFYGMAALSLVPDLHGNSLEALGPHDVYAIRDLETGQIYHFGETGRGAQVRGEEWQTELFEKYGLETQIESLGIFEGKSLAKAVETRYIRTYEKVFGHKPGFFDEQGNFVQTQLTFH
jgi:RHS repeat-associated protein